MNHTLTFKQSQLKELAKTITASYFKMMGEKQLPPDMSLKKMFLTILAAKEEELRIARQITEQQILKLTQAAFISEQKHVQHADEKEIDQLVLSKQNSKILSRLIDVKNEKCQQLAHLAQKYDKLLEIVRELRENEGKFKKEIQSLKQEKEELMKEQVKKNQKKKTQQKLREQIDGIRKKMATVQIQKTNLRQGNAELKKYILGQIEEMEEKYLRGIANMKSEYQRILRQFIDTMKQNNSQFKLINSANESKISQLHNIIKELIINLSEATKFQKKQTETDEEWLQEFRKFKKEKNTLNQEQTYKSSLFPASKSNANENFIEETRRFLSRFQKA